MMLECIGIGAAGAFLGWLAGRKREPRCVAYNDDSFAMLFSHTRCPAVRDHRCEGRQCTQHCKENCGGACIKAWKQAIGGVP